MLLFSIMESYSGSIKAQTILKSAVNKAETCQLTFGWARWRPLQYKNEKGELKGFQVDLVNAIADEMNCVVEFVEGDWQQLISGLQEGIIDFVADATKTEARTEFAHFSIPYRRDTFAIYVRKQDVNKYRELELGDLKKLNFKLAVNRGFLYGEEIEAWQNDNQYNDSIIYSDNSGQNFEKLIVGDIDGFIEDPYVMAYKFRSQQAIKNMATLPIVISSHTACFMFNKKKFNLDFVNKFNLALTKVKARPEFQISWLKL